MSKGSLRLSMSGSFTPLVLSATGGMGQAAAVANKRMASPLAEKKGATLLQDHGLASVCTEFLFDLLSHSVHSWCQIDHTQARQTVSGITN